MSNTPQDTDAQGTTPPPTSPPPVTTPEEQQRIGNGMAVTGLVLGIVGVIFAVLPFLFVAGFVLGILGVIFGVLGWRKPIHDPRRGGKNMGIAGTVLGAIAIVIAIGWGIVSTIALNQLDQTLNELPIEMEQTEPSQGF